MKVNRILFVNRRLSVGGAERVMTLLANAMAERGINVDMVVLQNMEQTYEVSPKVNLVQFKHESLNPIFRGIKRIVALRKIIKKGSYDAIISFMHIDSFYTLIAGFGMRNIIISERNDPRRFNKLYVKIGRRLLYPMAKQLVFQTDEAMSCFPRKIREKSCIIPNPINNNLPQPYEGIREKIVVAVGRMVPQKNFKLAIDAFELVHKEFPEHKLIIYGDGPLKKEMMEYAREKGLENFIDFPGFVKDIIEKIRKADVYISSSDFEGISNSMLEAIAMGIPSVCTDCPVGGAAMIIKNNEKGILVPVGDKFALYDGIKRILSDKDFALKLSRNAVKIRKEYSIDNICQKWLDVIDK